MTVKLYSPPTALLLDAWQEFDCQPLPQFSCRREDRRTANRRAKVTATVDSFMDVMASDSPPQTEEEAIAILVPTATWLLSWLIRQLVVQVVKFCWRRWVESQSKPQT